MNLVITMVFRIMHSRLGSRERELPDYLLRLLKYRAEIECRIERTINRTILLMTVYY